MPIIKWSNDFSINIEELDRHHKRLIEIVNDLNDAKEAGSEHEIIDEILDDLLMYVNTHFAREEELMKEHGYSELDEHKSQHEDLLKQLLSIIKLYSKNGLDIVNTLITLLDTWMKDHIIIQDKKYSACLNNRGIT